MFVSFSVQMIFFGIVLRIVGTHSLTVFAGGQRCANNAPVSWLLVLLFENKKNWEITEENVARQTFVHKIRHGSYESWLFPFLLLLLWRIRQAECYPEKSFVWIDEVWALGLERCQMSCQILPLVNQLTELVGKKDPGCNERKRN